MLPPGLPASSGLILVIEARVDQSGAVIRSPLNGLVLILSVLREDWGRGKREGSVLLSLQSVLLYL